MAYCAGIEGSKQLIEWDALCDVAQNWLHVSLLNMVCETLSVAFVGTVYVINLLPEQYSQSSMPSTKEYWKNETCFSFVKLLSDHFVIVELLPVVLSHLLLAMVVIESHASHAAIFGVFHCPLLISI